MKASAVLTHFQEIGHWVDWTKTCDEFLHGDPGAEVQKIATAWTATNDCIRRAAEIGANLLIVHEPAFCGGYSGTRWRNKVVSEKHALLDELGITILRCHDTWDRMPEVGIPDAWARWLGFETEARPVESFYKVCLVGGLTVKETAARVLEKVGPLGQEVIMFYGDPDANVNRLAVGTGAITHLPSMLDLDVDAILATDDGMNTWDGALLAVDLTVPLLIVNHATAEKPGMMAMANYLAQQFPSVPVEYIDVAMPYRVVTSVHR